MYFTSAIVSLALLLLSEALAHVSYGPYDGLVEVWGRFVVINTRSVNLGYLSPYIHDFISLKCTM